MRSMILELSTMSVLLGLILSFTPEGGCKKITSILCTASLLLCLLKPFIGFDFEAYAAEMVKAKNLENNFISQSIEVEKKLNRAIIESQSEEYILDTAYSLGLENIKVDVETKWHIEEIWVPYSVKLNGEWDKKEQEYLAKTIEAGLGIPEERQFWQSE